MSHVQSLHIQYDTIADIFKTLYIVEIASEIQDFQGRIAMFVRM